MNRKHKSLTFIHDGITSTTSADSLTSTRVRTPGRTPTRNSKSAKTPGSYQSPLDTSSSPALAHNWSQLPPRSPMYSSPTDHGLPNGRPDEPQLPALGMFSSSPVIESPQTVTKPPYMSADLTAPMQSLAMRSGSQGDASSAAAAAAAAAIAASVNDGDYSSPLHQRGDQFPQPELMGSSPLSEWNSMGPPRFSRTAFRAHMYELSGTGQADASSSKAPIAVKYHVQAPPQTVSIPSPEHANMALSMTDRSVSVPQDLSYLMGPASAQERVASPLTDSAPLKRSFSTLSDPEIFSRSRQHRSRRMLPLQLVVTKHGRAEISVPHDNRPGSRGSDSANSIVSAWAEDSDYESDSDSEFKLDVHVSRGDAIAAFARTIVRSGTAASRKAKGIASSKSSHRSVGTPRLSGPAQTKATPLIPGGINLLATPGRRPPGGAHGSLSPNLSFFHDSQTYQNSLIKNGFSVPVRCVSPPSSPVHQAGRRSPAAEASTPPGSVMLLEDITMGIYGTGMTPYLPSR